MRALTDLRDRGVAVIRLALLGGALVWGVVRYVFVARHRKSAAARAVWLQGVCQCVLRALRVKIDQTGEAPRGGLICSNHLSYLDILVFSALQPVIFVSKKEVRAWPIFGWFAEKAGTRFIDRTKKADVRRIAEELSPLLAQGLSVVVFLEGTTSDGSNVLPFRSSLLEPALQGGWSLAPAAISYACPLPFKPESDICWWGDMTLTPHLLRLASISWIQARVAWGRFADGATDRKILAARLREQVISLKSSLLAAPSVH